MKQVKWKRKNGQVIPLEKLSDSHILNIISLLGRTIDKDVPRLFPRYKDLVAEAKKRKLLEVLK